MWLDEPSWLTVRWCVDLGDSIGCMSSQQILSGLERGWLDRAAKIWREGRPWWLPVSDVRDFEWAAAAMSEPSTAPGLAEAPDELSVIRAQAASSGFSPEPATSFMSRRAVRASADRRLPSSVASAVHGLPRWLVRSLQLAGGLTAGILLAWVAL